MTKVSEYKKRRKLLVDALRSGKYPQGQNRLRKSDGFCCLGVACEIYRQEHPEAKWDGNGIYQFLADEDTPPSVSLLPRAVRKWFGFNSEGGSFRIENSFNDTLMGLNDSGMPFSQIADLIEYEPEGMFK